MKIKILLAKDDYKREKKLILHNLSKENVDLYNYNEVYSFNCDIQECVETLVTEVFFIFQNTEYTPSEYRNRSLKTGDIICIDEDIYYINLNAINLANKVI